MFIIALPIVVAAVLVVAAVTAIIARLVCCKNRRRRVSHTVEMSEYATVEKPSDSKRTFHRSKSPERYEMRRMSSEYVDIGVSPPGPVDTLEMERKVVYGADHEGESDTIYEEVMEDGEYEPVNSSTPQPESQTQI